jgi:hypothetical protein
VIQRIQKENTREYPYINDHLLDIVKQTTDCKLIRDISTILVMDGRRYIPYVSCLDRKKKVVYILENLVYQENYRLERIDREVRLMNKRHKDDADKQHLQELAQKNTEELREKERLCWTQLPTHKCDKKAIDYARDGMKCSICVHRENAMNSKRMTCDKYAKTIQNTI